jgi:two-component system, chemotaxis family, chemotaxis protein CheY
MSEPEPPFNNQRSILIVDDDESTLQMLATFLQRHGYRTLTAPDPIRALEILQSETVHLVVTDLMMPHVDGIGFTQRVHAMPKHADVPVILLTASGDDSVTEQGLRKGVALTLSKPIELSKLLDLVGFATH